MKTLTMTQLNEVWERILKDPDARKAFTRLEKDGLGIAHLSPNDPTFKHPCWADFIAALPFLPNQHARRQVHRRSTLRKYLPLVKELRRFARRADDKFCESRILSEMEFALNDILDLPNHLRQTADFLEKFLSWDWYTRDVNPRNCCIAQLRWRIRQRTGGPHDRELAVLIDAAFRAAGFAEGLYLDPTALDRIENREKEGRVKATCRLRGLTVPRSLTRAGDRSHSTRLRPNR